jgi:pilus assembly protein Flp/PilA
VICAEHSKHTFGKVTVMKMLSSLKSQFAAFKADESGATLIEYGVIVALILAISVAIIKTIGNKVKTGLTNVQSSL